MTIRSVKMYNLEEVLKEDYERIKELLGKKEGEKYINDNRGNFKAIYFKVLKLELKAYAKLKPLSFSIYLVIFLLVAGFMIYNHFTY